MTLLSGLLFFYIPVLVLLIVISVLFYYLWFLRNPNIKVVHDDLIISPANGKISAIIRFGADDKNNEQDNKYNKHTKDIININKGRFGRILALTRDVASSGYIICIAMNLLNVHYQRSPVYGAVKNIKYTKGKFRNIFKDIKGLRFIDNERNEVLIRSTPLYGEKKVKFNVKVIQIAGLFAKRIKCFVKPGQAVEKGQLLGLIRRGSMVVLIVPDNVKPVVKNGQKVKLGANICSII